MAEIALQEQTIQPQAFSSAFPLHLEPHAVEQPSGKQQQRQMQMEHTAEGAESSRYLPCHYFDYTVGTGFGGYVHLFAIDLVDVAFHKLIHLVLLPSCWAV